MPLNARSLLRKAGQALRLLSRSQGKYSLSKPRNGHYPGDFDGRPAVSYSPASDDQADPGEIVWTWVPFEEDHTQGKDRPVLLIGRDGSHLLGLMLTSRDRTNSSRSDPDYVDIGRGAWDRQGRSSEVNVARIVRVAPDRIRRIGAVLPKTSFNRVIRSLDAQ
ncbi:type II toxin-antitoxin system PemK/MazF family toxin [Arthrobacter sp. H5]|uniref:type II toxin-antitoxin system PemK/MazF family toxin n=1 Tax=Arthrobacter sp. H5 TaxID=1267973 RepID=UPI0004AFB6F6|nr:type II toxin-antitoxin system PemK/MazF family toxin [Arthrobacter sp. H5]